MRARFNRILILVAAAYSCRANLAGPGIAADPDFIATGFEFCGVPILKIGDYVAAKYVDAGGFFEARNETRFTRAILPNHNWRGFGFVRGSLSLVSDMIHSYILFAGFEHESAHSTMGIEEPTSKSYERIYDGRYRRYMLNSLGAAAAHKRRFGRWAYETRFDYRFYFLSKNTPELPSQALATSHGVSAGTDVSYRIAGNVRPYMSVFGRMIFKGRSSVQDSVWYGDDASLTIRYGPYPVINDIYTLSIKSGVALQIASIRRAVGIYCRFLIGNISGFVDSRDMRRRLSAGIELFRSTRGMPSDF